MYGSRVYRSFPLIFQASAKAPAVEQRDERQEGKGHKGTWQQRSCGPSASLRSLAALRDAVGRHSRRVPPLASLAGPSVAALPPAMPSAALEWWMPTAARCSCPQVDPAAKGGDGGGSPGAARQAHPRRTAQRPGRCATQSDQIPGRGINGPSGQQSWHGSCAEHRVPAGPTGPRVDAQDQHLGEMDRT